MSRLYAVKINVTSFSRVVLVGFQQGSAVTLITNSINFFGPAVQIMANYSVCVVHSTLFTFNIGSLVNQVPFLSHSLIWFLFHKMHLFLLIQIVEFNFIFKISVQYFFNLFNFNQRVIALQYCVDQYESAMVTCMSPPTWTSLPSPIPFHPSRLNWAPDLNSLYHTANICQVSNFAYGNIYVSVLLSQFIPPSPSPSVSTSLFS